MLLNRALPILLLALSCSAQSRRGLLMGTATAAASGWSPVVNASVTFEAAAPSNGAVAGTITTSPALDGTGTTLWIVSGVTSGGSTFVVDSSPHQTGASAWVCHGPYTTNSRDHYICASPNPTGSMAAATVSVTTNSSNGAMVAMKGFYGKTPGGTPFDSTTGASDPVPSTPGSWSPGAITVTAGELVIAWTDGENQIASSAGQISINSSYNFTTGFSFAFNMNGDANCNNLLNAYYVAASSTSYTPTWTTTYTGTGAHVNTGQASFF